MGPKIKANVEPRIYAFENYEKRPFHVKIKKAPSDSAIKYNREKGTGKIEGNIASGSGKKRGKRI